MGIPFVFTPLCAMENGGVSECYTGDCAAYYVICRLTLRKHFFSKSTIPVSLHVVHV